MRFPSSETGRASVSSQGGRFTRFTRRRAFKALSVAVTAIIFIVVLPRIANYRDVRSALTDFQPAWIAPLLVIGAANLVAPAASQVAALPGLRLRRAAIADWTTSALTNVVPGGSALSIGLTAAMYRSWGHPPQAIGQSIILTGIWDVIIKLAMPSAALVFLATTAPLSGGLVQAAIVGAVLLIAAVLLLLLVAGSPAVAASLSRPIRRIVSQARIEEWRQATLRLLSQRWRQLTFWTLAGHLNLAAMLWICVRGAGVASTELSGAAILAAFAFGRLVTAIPITPGGLGVMELGLVGALMSGTAASIEPAIVAAVLLFRFLSFAVPIPLGLAGWLWWMNSEGRSS